MHFPPDMHDPSRPPSPPTAEAPPEIPRHEAVRGRLARFGREHPALTVVGLAGAGLLGGVEVAAGVLLGAGIAAWLRRPDGAALTEGSAEPRGRMRRLLERTPHNLHELKERTRAVIRAARGELEPPPADAREAAAPPPETSAPAAPA